MPSFKHRQRNGNEASSREGEHIQLRTQLISFSQSTHHQRQAPMSVQMPSIGIESKILKRFLRLMISAIHFGKASKKTVSVVDYSTVLPLSLSILDSRGSFRLDCHIYHAFL